MTRLQAVLGKLLYFSPVPAAFAVAFLDRHSPAYAALCAATGVLALAGFWWRARLRAIRARMLETIPFNLDRCGRGARAEAQEVISGLLGCAAHAPPPPAAPLYEPSADPLELPAGAPPVIGLAGKPRAGKDVVADYLQARYAGVARTAISDQIVEEANAWLAAAPGLLGRRHRITPENKSLPQYRRLLQFWGLRRRGENPRHWVEKVIAAAGRMRQDGARLVIITGVRMPSDMEMVSDLGGVTWKVERPGNPYQAEHAIEAGLDSVPDSEFVVISNPAEGDLAPYEANIVAALNASS